MSIATDPFPTIVVRPHRPQVASDLGQPNLHRAAQRRVRMDLEDLGIDPNRVAPQTIDTLRHHYAEYLLTLDALSAVIDEDP